MEQYILMLILRLIHIFSGVFWAGTIFFFISFLQPAINASGPEGAKVMQRLATSRFPTAMPSIAGLAVLSGLVLYWFDSGGLQLQVISSGPGIGFTIGGAAALISLAIGLAVTTPTNKRIGALAGEIAASGKPPSPEQMTQMQALQMRFAAAAIWNAIFIALAVAGMAVARYL